MERILLAWLCCLAAASAAADPLPFARGERLTYDIYWTVVHAGDATLEILPDRDLEGRPVLRFLATARTTPFVDAFYKVRDRIESVTDPQVGQSLLYLKEQREGSYERDYRVVFDWDQTKAFRYGRQGLKNAVFIWPGTLDPLSMLFAFRKAGQADGAEFSCPVTDGEQCVLSLTRIVGRERVETPLGPMDCFLAEPELKHVGGVFRKSPDAKIQVWFSADERRIPVMVKSKVAVGHFTLLLTSFRPGEGD